MSATFTFILGTLCAIFALSTNAQCGKKCRWKLCKLNGRGDVSDFRRLNLRGPRTALSPYVCLPGSPDVRMIKTGEAKVSTQKKGKNARPISKFRPRGLRKKFPRKYFQLYPICFTDGLQGVGRWTAAANQEDFLDNLCVVLPIKSYKLGGRTITTRKKKDCLAFGTRTREIIVELQWDSADDLDLCVIEPPPSGQTLDFNNPSTPSGTLNNDIGVAACDSLLPSGKENAFYFKDGGPILNGEFGVKVKHFNNCGKGATKWKLRVIVNGKIVLEEMGTSNKDNGEVIFMGSFSYP